MKGNKQRQKVIPHCYRRNRSRTLSNSCLSISQLVQIGAYKKKVNDLSRNNRHLATALQEARLEVAVHQNILKDYAKDCNNILFARLKLNEMARNVSKFVTDLEEVRSYLNFDLPSDKNPFTLKKGSPNERISKAPAVNCIQEVSYESSVNEVVPLENIPASNPQPASNSDDKKTDTPPNNPEDNVMENIEIAPILFADDSEGRKKSSTKSRISKKSSDPDKESLTPVLNIDLTSVKLKRNSSRRQTQFLFPGSRSTSKGKASSEKENIFEELMTPAKSSYPTLNHHEQDAPIIKQSLEQIESPIIKDIKEKKFKSPSKVSENHLKVDHDVKQCDPSNNSASNLANNFKPAVVLEVQQGETNQTVHMCEDMELTEVIRPIIHTSDEPFGVKSFDNFDPGCDITKNNDVIEFGEEDRNMKKDIQESRNLGCIITKKDDTLQLSEEVKNRNINKDIISKQDDALSYDDGMQLPKISENDEVQNVALITFCEPSDKNVVNNGKKSSFRVGRSKPVKCAVFFSSDDDDDDNSPLAEKSKRKTVIPAKSSKPHKKASDAIDNDKISQEKENEMKIDNLLNYPIDVLHSEKSEKKGEKKAAKKSKDKASSKKKSNSSKQLSKKCSVTSKDGNLKVNKAENIKMLEHNEDLNAKISSFNHKDDLPKHLSHTLSTKSHEKNIKPSGDVNVKKLKLTHKNDMLKPTSQKSSTLSKDKNIKLSEDNNAKNFVPTHQNLNLMFSPISSPGILKKTQSKLEKNEEIGSETPLNRIMFSDNSDDSITKAIESPKSESRKVSFAPLDLVCKFRKMSVSRKIAENKKVRRTSKSVLDFKELLEEEAQSKTPHVDADNFSESTNGRQNVNNQDAFNFSGDTELYTLQFPCSFLTVPTTDDLMPKFNASSNVAQKSNSSSKKNLVLSKPVKKIGKLSLKKHKNVPNSKEPADASAELFKEKTVLLESPISVNKPAKRKSLFKVNLDEDLKENISHPIPDKIEDVVQKISKTVIDVSTDLPTKNNALKKSTSTQNQRKTIGKCSAKKLSEKHETQQTSSEVKKKKKQSVAVKSLENSPVLKDTINLPETYDRIASKRRSKPVIYKEPSLNKKLRRE